MPTSILNPVEPERTPLQDGEGPDTLQNDTIVTLTPHLPEIPGYEVIQELGRGGMGIVFKARDVRLKRLVAIKMLLDPEFASPEQRMRFRIEAEAVAQLRHPHIVQVYELGEMPGIRGGIPHPYMVLEYVEGPTLFRYLREHTFTENEAALLMITLARAIQHAHDHGLIHRDLKPSNILLSHEQAVSSSESTSKVHIVPGSLLNPKITDFGLVKAMSFDDDTRRDLTAPEFLVGTPQYMAPELADPENRVPRCSIDIYSLGVIFYELLTEHLPFEANDVLQMLVEAQTVEPPSPRKFKPQLNRDLETICLKCLDKDPHRRYQSAAALADDLTRYLHHEPIQARPLSEWQRFRKWMRRHPAMATLVGLLFTTITAALIVIGSFWYQAEQERHQAEIHSNQADIARDLARISEQTAREAAQKAQNAEQVARESEERTRLSLYYSKVAQVDLLLRQGQLQRAENLLDHSWPAQDKADPRSWEYYHLKRLCRPMEQTIRHARDYIQSVQFLPNQQGLLACEGAEYFGDYQPQEFPGRVYLFYPDAHQKPWKHRVVYTNRLPLKEMQVTSDGRYALVMDMKGLYTILDLTDLKASEKIQSHGLPAGKLYKLASRGGKILYWDPSALPKQVELLDIATRERLHTIDLPDICSRVEISDDGSRILFVTQDEKVGIWDIRTNQSLWMKNFPVKEWCLAISSDGSQAGIGCYISGDIYWVNTGDGSLLRQINLQRLLHLRFSPDQKQLLATAHNQQGHDIILWSASSSGSVPLILRGHEGQIYSIHFNETCSLLASTGIDGTVRVWNIDRNAPNAGDCLRVYRGHKGTVRTASFDPHSTLLASGGIDANVILWDTNRNLYFDKYSMNAHAGGEWVTDFRFVENTNLIAYFQHQFQQLIHLDLETRTVVKRVQLPGIAGEFRAPRQDARFSADGRRLACIDNTGHHVLVFDVMTGQQIWKSPEMPFYVFRLCFSGDDKRLLMAGHFLQPGSKPPSPVPFQCEYQVWNMERFELIHREVMPYFTTSICLNQDGTQIAAVLRSAHRKQWLRLIDLAAGGSYRYTREFDLERCICLVFSPDGQWLAGCNFVPDQNVLTIRDARTGEEKHRVFAGYESTELTFTPDSQRVLVTGYDSNIVFFDTVLGYEIFTLKHHGSPRRNDYALNPRIVFNKTGTRLAINSWDAVLSVWHAYKPQSGTDSKK